MSPTCVFGIDISLSVVGVSAAVRGGINQLSGTGLSRGGLLAPGERLGRLTLEASR
jgi:hypothetical protein